MRIKKLIYQIILSLSLPALTSNAIAADVASAVANLPNLFDAGRVGARLESRGNAPAQTAAPLATQQQKSAAVNPEMAKIRFVLKQVTLEGNTIFSTAELSTIYTPYLNKDISLATLQEVAEAITKKYRENGYVLSRAILPPQEIKNGAVKIQVIEGFISKVNISGNPGKTASLLQKYGEHISQSRPLNIHVLEHYILLANDLPGVSVKAVLLPSKVQPASAELNLVVERQKGSVFSTYDNYGTRYIGPNQISLGGSLYSLLTGGDSNQARVITTTKGRELKFGELVHSQPVGSEGMTWTTATNYTQTQPEFTLEPFNIVGRSAQVYTDLAYPFIRTREKNVYVHSMLNYQNVTSTILDSPFYQDRFRSVILGSSYNGTDRWSGYNTASLDYEHSFPILGAHKHFYQSRPEGETPYNKFTATLSRLQGISSRLSLLAAARGQYTANTLLSTVQFGYGGPDFGRGYDPSEIVGDKGAAGKLELRIDTWPELRFLPIVQYYTFYDAGIIWNLDKTNLPPEQSATSTGIGARLTFLPQLSANVFIAKPLTRPVATMELLGRNAKSARGFFQLVAVI